APSPLPSLCGPVAAPMRPCSRPYAAPSPPLAAPSPLPAELPSRPAAELPSRPAAEPPLEQPPLQQPPLEQPPLQQPPLEQPPLEQPPLERPPLQQPPLERPPLQQPPLEQPPLQQPPLEQPPPEQPPLQQQPPEQPPLQQPPLEQPPLQQPPLEQPPLQQPPPEQPPLQQPPPEQPPLQQPPLEQPPLEQSPLQLQPLEQPPLQLPRSSHSTVVAASPLPPSYACSSRHCGSRPGVSSLAAACSGQVQLQRRPRVVLSPQQLREWYAQRDGSRGTARCPYVIRTGARTGQPCGTLGHVESRCFARLSDAWRMEFGDAAELPDWVELFRLRVDIYTLDYDAILTAMYALPTSDKGDCYLCVPPDPCIEAAALGAGEAAALGASASAAPGAGESALSGTESAQVFHTFTLDSGASRSFFRDHTTLTPLSRPVAVSLADLSGGSVLARFSIVLPCPAAPSGTLPGLYLPSFSTNLVSGADLQDQGVDQFTPASQRVTHCTCARMGRHLATFTCRPGSSLYTLSTESPPVPASGQVLGLPPSPGPAPPLECPQPVQSQSQLQPVSPLPAPSPYTSPTGGLAERREPASHPASPVRTASTSRRALRLRPPAVPGTHRMTLRPSTAHLRVPLPSPPESSLPALADPETDSLRAASPTVARLLSTVVTDPSFESTTASALVAELVDFAARCRLDYATRLVAASESVCPPSVGGECALSTDVLEDRQEEFQCFSAALPHLVSTLIAPEGDPDAPDIPTLRS
ncbi:unnamed protein product, partial [Closterium sp. NIES-53]